MLHPTPYYYIFFRHIFLYFKSFVLSSLILCSFSHLWNKAFIHSFSPGGKSVSKSIIGEQGGCSRLVVGGSLVVVFSSGWASVDSVLFSPHTGSVSSACTSFCVSSSSWLMEVTSSDFPPPLRGLLRSVAGNETNKEEVKFGSSIYPENWSSDLLHSWYMKPQGYKNKLC